MFGLHDKNKADVSSFGTGDNKIKKRYSIPPDRKAESLQTPNKQQQHTPLCLPWAPGPGSSQPRPRVGPRQVIWFVRAQAKQHVFTITLISQPAASVWREAPGQPVGWDKVKAEEAGAAQPAFVRPCK